MGLAPGRCAAGTSGRKTVYNIFAVGLSRRRSHGAAGSGQTVSAERGCGFHFFAYMVFTKKVAKFAVNSVK